MATKINASFQFGSTADWSAGGWKITNVATPINGTDAVNKDYVDAVSTGLDVKASVRAATTANITLSGIQTVDGVSLSTGNRVLVKNQTAASQNGIYTVAVGSWTRSNDANSNLEVTAGMFTFVEEGTIYGDTGWILSTNDDIVLDTTPLTFTQFSGAGTYTAGNGLTLLGSQFSVVTGDSSNITVGVGINLATTSVIAGTYGDSNYNVAQIQVDSYGRLTTANGAKNRDMFPAKVANTFFAGPGSGGNAAPTFRVMNLTDVLTGLVTTPATAAQGQLLIGNGSNFTQATLSGSGITITNGAGTITLTNAGVTSLTGTANQITVSASTGGVTLSLAATGVTLPGKTTLTASTTAAASLNVPTGAAPTTPVTGDFWLVNATGLLGYYNAGTHTIADLDSVQTFTNKTETNPTLASISADGAATTGLFLNGSNKMVTRTLGSNAFNSTTYITSVSGTTDRITSTGGTTPVIDIASTYVGQTSLTTLGTVTTGTWSATTIAVTKGGTGITSYTDGQLLIGRSSGNTLLAGTLTAGANISITYTTPNITIATSTDVCLQSKLIFKQAIAGTPNGTATGTTTFTLGSTPVALKEMIFVNGVLQNYLSDYNISGSTVTFLAGAFPQTGDTLLATYIAV